MATPAVGAVLWVVLRVTPLPPYQAEPVGGHYLPQSPLRWVVRPVARVEPPPHAFGFVVDDGRLRPLPPEALRLEKGGLVTLEGPAGVLLGATTGARTLVLALAPGKASVEDPSGSPWPGVQENASVFKWFSVVIDYRKGE